MSQVISPVIHTIQHFSENFGSRIIVVSEREVRYEIEKEGIKISDTVYLENL